MDFTMSENLDLLVGQGAFRAIGVVPKAIIDAGGIFVVKIIMMVGRLAGIACAGSREGIAESAEVEG